MITVWLALLVETVVVTGIAAALARWSSRRYGACSDPASTPDHDIKTAIREGRWPTDERCLDAGPHKYGRA